MSFTAKNVVEDAAAREELIARTGRTAVPVILVGDEVVVGFDRGRLKRRLGSEMRTMEVACPDCGEAVAVPSPARPGDLLDCPNCAGHAFRLACTDGRWSATLAHQVNCPSCNQLLTLPAEARVGDTVECCGQRYRLTFEYGAFAAEAAEEPKEGCMSHNHWLALGVVSTVLTCVACLTPVLALALGAIGLGAWTGRLEIVLVLLFVGFAALAAYRYWSRPRRPS